MALTSVSNFVFFGLFYYFFLFFLAFFGSEGPGSGFLWFYFGFLHISVKVAVLHVFSLVAYRFL